MHYERFNHSSLFYGGDDYAESADVFLRVFDLADRQDRRQSQPHFLHFKTDFYVVHAASLCLTESLAQRYFGIVKSDSARSRFVKFSSPSSLSNALTIKTSFASHIFAFLTAIFCRALSRRYTLSRLSALVLLLRVRRSVLRSFPSSRRCSISRFTVRMENWFNSFFSYAL